MKEWSYSKFEKLGQILVGRARLWSQNKDFCHELE